METTNNYPAEQNFLSEDLFIEDVSYAGFWLRFVAYILDILLLYLGAVIIMLPFYFFDGNYDNADSRSDGYEFLFLGLFVAFLAYFPLMESSSWQATIGKRAVGIKVIGTNGNRISFGKAFARLCAKFLSALVVYAGFIMIAFSKRKQGLHDLIAETWVIKSR